MKSILLFITILTNVCLYSQTKGASPQPAPNSGEGRGEVYAVVVGISDYQDKAIPDLRFADKDADAFANYLRSPAGGSLDGDHLKVLTNQQATAGRLAEALDGLIELAKEGDQIIIYFSGHGDVEGKKISQPGFLLCWDAPSRVYMGGGTYSLAYLQEVITTLSLQNKARVTVIADACRAGKLAGSQIGGSQLTAANLAKQFSNEIKILSCQPGELSLEGEQWGGGRGCFSHHLVEGLYGFADRNSDGMVTLGELDRYLEDNVTTETAPQSQVPILLGNKTERLSRVNAVLLAELQKRKAREMPLFAATESRGLEDAVLAKVDTNIRAMYHAFKLAVQQKRFFAPAGNSAEEYFTQLSAVEALASLKGVMSRNYAAALQDDAQQTLNGWLNTSQDASLQAKIRLPEKLFTESLRTFPRCLDRAAELLGEKHYMYRALKARKYFFEGYLLANSKLNPDTAFGNQVLSLFRQSIQWQPEQPQVYWQMSRVFGWNLQEPDSLEYYALYAAEMNPNWVLPLTSAAFLLSVKFNKQDRARQIMEKASLIDSNSAIVFNQWAGINMGQKNFTEAERQFKKAIALDSTYAIFWNNLGHLYNQIRRFSEAELVLKKAIALDSTKATFWNNLGYLYNQVRRFADAELVLKKAIELDSGYATFWYNLGMAYALNGRSADAVPFFEKTVELDSTDIYNVANLGAIYTMTRRYSDAEPWLIKAIALDSALASPYKHLGLICFKTNRPNASRQYYLQALQLNPNYAGAMLGMAYVLQSEGKTAEAIGYVEQAIIKGSTFEQLNEDEELKSLRSQAEWKALMQNFFPDKMK
ncbi:MAG: tetratricopeptide repeat protein [Saprospiraceae bacterium]|nr:tetratricopeptide repeat protein [Saprospiraceae bacterium]